MMGLFDGIIGGVVGAEMATVVNGILTRHGGLGGVIQEFQAKGFGDTIKSWVSTGENMPITSDQISKVIGPDLLTQLAGKAGMTPDELSSKLSSVLPGIIDKMTPHGTIPAPAQ